MAQPAVGIIMGSDSDWDTVAPAAEILAEFGIAFEVGVVSAHRTPDKMLAYAKEAHTRDLQVIIACAGGAAHLPGMVAAATPLPVIGIPRALDTLDGLDSLLSIVQMPGGVPGHRVYWRREERWAAGRAHHRRRRPVCAARDGGLPSAHGAGSGAQGRGAASASDW